MPNTPDDRLSYSGPDLTFTPTIGNNANVTKKIIANSSTTYANMDILEDDLTALLDALKSFKDDLENTLITKGLPISPLDLRLQESNDIQWPSDDLGDPKEYVSYRYYKYVQLDNSTASQVIKKKFEQAARDIGGTPALDLISLVDAMQNEATLIKEFSRTYVNQLTDAAEHRTVELFQDWTQSALYHTGNFRNFFQTGVSSTLPEDEVETLSSPEARNSQAVFKVKLNDVNNLIDAAQEYLDKNFTQYATVFYGNFLAPALQFRLTVSNKFFPNQGTLGQELDRATTSLNANLSMLQGDQMRRNAIFDKQATQIYNLLNEQGTYKNYIQQLAPVGQALPTATGLIDVQDTEDEIEIFDTAEGATPSTNTSIASPHNLLEGRDVDDAHSQYLLLDGGVLTGNLEISDGIEIDGIVPHTHAHTGDDGSAKIEGKNIVGGTLQTSLIDQNEQPDTPENLRLNSSDVMIVPPGVATIDVEVAWDGDLALRYDVEITSVIN